MLRKKGKHPLVRVVRISEELLQVVQQYAEPLEDNFESACWKMLESINKK